MKGIQVFAAVVMLSLQAKSQADGKKIIDKICGCFQVDFRYAETFSPDPDYKYHEREETGGTAELALPIEITDTSIVIQHLLVVGPRTVVKHWREEWTYQNPVRWKYMGNRTWQKEILNPEQVRGQWTQTVWEVADEPRYQGFSPFVHLDGKIIWQNTADAPLPRREYSVRSDYNILRRTNRLQITDSGYLHEQDNQKIIRSAKGDQLLVEEKGHNIYKRLPEHECAAALEYWEKNRVFWARVRKAWTGYLGTLDQIKLENKVGGKMLHEYLIGLSQEYLNHTVSEMEIDQRVQSEIRRFVVKPDGTDPE